MFEISMAKHPRSHPAFARGDDGRWIGSYATLAGSSYIVHLDPTGVEKYFPIFLGIRIAVSFPCHDWDGYIIWLLHGFMFLRMFVCNKWLQLQSLVFSPIDVDAATHLRTAVGCALPVKLSTLNFRIPIWILQHSKLDVSSFRMRLMPESPTHMFLFCPWLSLPIFPPKIAMTLSSTFSDFKCPSQIPLGFPSSSAPLHASLRLQTPPESKPRIPWSPI